MQASRLVQESGSQYWDLCTCFQSQLIVFSWLDKELLNVYCQKNTDLSECVELSTHHVD